MAVFRTMKNSHGGVIMIKKHRLVSAITVVGSLAGCANMSSGEQRTLSGAAIGTAAGRRFQPIGGELQSIGSPAI